jgi:hypothetical protein
MSSHVSSGKSCTGLTIWMPANTRDKGATCSCQQVMCVSWCNDVIPLVLWEVLQRAHTLDACNVNKVTQAIVSVLACCRRCVADDVIPLFLWEVLHRAHKLDACKHKRRHSMFMSAGYRCWCDDIIPLVLLEVLHRAHKLDACNNKKPGSFEQQIMQA